MKAKGNEAMKLTLKEITEITRGTVRITENNGVFSFYRFTEQQTEAYRTASPDNFYKKSFATAGVRLAFKTDSTAFGFDFQLTSASSRPYAYFDVYVNDALAHHFGVEGKTMKGSSISISLPEGEKKVEIFFPFSYSAQISNVEIDDGATLSGVTRPKKMISFGDSITHGYDAIYPSLSYASRLASLLNAEQVNKGIGGEKFFPALLDEKDPFDPDYITVAYGTNDWNSKLISHDTFEANCREFYSRLSKMYPSAKIFAIAPIWRLDGNRTNSGFGAPVTEVYPLIKEICKDLPNVTVIDAYTFVPHRKEFFSDLRVHPNDLGFGLYAEELYKKIVAAL